MTLAIGASKWIKARDGSSLPLAALLALEQSANTAAFRRASKAAQQEAGVDHAHLYTDDVLDARCMIRYHAGVIAELRKWTRALDAHQRYSLKSMSLIKAVDKSLYTPLFVKVCLAMTTKASMRQVREIVEEDWETDRRGKEAISIEQLKDCLFELGIHTPPAGRHPTQPRASHPPTAYNPRLARG